MVGLGILLGAMLFGGAESAGGVVAAPFLVVGLFFKLALFVLLMGFVAKAFGARSGGHKRPSGRSHEQWAEEARQWWHRSQGESRPDSASDSETDRFEEWHRMAHAKEEVDNHTPPVED